MTISYLNACLTNKLRNETYHNITRDLSYDSPLMVVIIKRKYCLLVMKKKNISFVVVIGEIRIQPYYKHVLL